MDDRIEIAFRDMTPSAPIVARVREHVETLGRFVAGAEGLRAEIGPVPLRGGLGRAYAVRLELHLPRLVLSVDRWPEDDRAHESPCAAVRDAFARLENGLNDAHVGIDAHDARLAATA